MSVSDEELTNCISHIFGEQEKFEERLKEEENFIKREAEKVGAKAEYKMVRDMSETERLVKSALMEQGEEYNEIIV